MFMQWRCYSCGLKMGNGMPPTEALDAHQAALVGGDVFRVEAPWPFDDMSRAQFCAWCLQFLDEFPSAAAMDRDASFWHNMNGGTGRVGYAYFVRTPETKMINQPNWVVLNRLMWLLNVCDAYPQLSDESVLNELVSTMEVML